MKRFILGLFFVMLFFMNGDIFADDSYVINSIEKQYVRVGISDNYFSAYLFDKVSLTSENSFIISDNTVGEVEFKEKETADINYTNGIFNVIKNGSTVFKTKNKLYIVSVNNTPLSIVGLKRKSKPALYSGSIELEISKSKQNKFAIVNVLPLQTYLKGVVPNEMPVSFGLEALKAQAVLARNYVLKPREKYYKEFDICDSTACQVYFGANTQEMLSDKAVDETENIVVLFDNDLILAVYSSTSGGYTESYKNVFMQNMGGRIMSPNVPYLIATPDKKGLFDENLDTEEKARAFYSSSPETFDNKSPYFRWKIKWTLDELEKILSKTIPTVKNTGFVRTKYQVDYSDKNFLGQVKSIYINRRGNSGKVIALTIITDKNEFTIYKELIIRKVFLYNNKILPSANVFFDFEKDDTGQNILTATGGGLGHGVGMSQWGAGAMSQKGYKYEDIIHHYYNGVNISVLPFKVLPETPLTIQFYTDTKKCVLKTENNIQISDLNIIINNKYVDTDLKKKLAKEKKADVSHYLKKGKNIITYELKSDREGKPLRFWLEIEE